MAARASSTRPFATFSLPLAAAAAELRPPVLEADQQRRLALAWLDVWARGIARTATERDWCAALAYLPSEWPAHRERFALVLDRGACWALPFMLAEADRQDAVSSAQRGRVASRWGSTCPQPSTPHDTGGIPAVADGLPTGSGSSACRKAESEPSRPLAAPDRSACAPERRGSNPTASPAGGPDSASSARDGEPGTPEARQGALTLVSVIAGKLGPEAPRPKPSGRDYVDPVAKAAAPLGAAGVRTALQVAGRLRALGIASVPVLVRFAEHLVERQTSGNPIRNPFAFYQPTGAGFEALRMRLAGDAAAAEAEQFKRAELAFLHERDAAAGAR